MGSISSVFGIVSFVGFLLFIAGIGLAVLAASQGRTWRGGVSLALAGVVIGVLFSIVGQGIILVGASEIAVVFNTVSGGLDPTPRTSGTHIIFPILQQATIYPVSQQEYTMSGSANEGSVQGDDAVEARTNDGQVVDLDITVFYRIDPAQVNRVHVDWQNRYESSFIRPTVRGTVRDVASQFSAEQIYSEGRAELNTQLEETVSARLAEEGFNLTDLLVRNVTFSPEFTASIERKTVAEQDAQRAEILVRQQQQESERVRVQANGQRDAAIAEAEGEAQSIILRAQAEAEALRLVSEQIAANPALIQYQYIQNLSDNVQIALVPSNSPFLFDFDSLLSGGITDFTAPEVPESSLDLGGSDATVTQEPTADATPAS